MSPASNYYNVAPTALVRNFRDGTISPPHYKSCSSGMMLSPNAKLAAALLTKSILVRKEEPSQRRTKYQHKVCSLEGCADKGAYGCMHCTCDGQCGLGHSAGQCGDYREGSRKSCVVEGCPKDDRCTHSRRAVCYTCRRNRVKGKQAIAAKKRTVQKRFEYAVKTSHTTSFLPGIKTLGQIGYAEDHKSLKNLWIRVQQKGLQNYYINEATR